MVEGLLDSVLFPLGFLGHLYRVFFTRTRGRKGFQFCRVVYFGSWVIRFAFVQSSSTDRAMRGENLSVPNVRLLL